jgi:hypothetical protein
MTASVEARKAWYAKNAVAERARKRAATEERLAALAGVQLYDIEDYIEEWGELTDLGMSCREIVARSRPSLKWFRENVLLEVDQALCGSCRRFFDPRAVRGTECSVACRNDYTGFGRRG